MNEQERQNLIGVLEQKKDWLQKMLQVTKQFEKQLLSDDVDAFAEGLKKREDMIAKIDAFVRIQRNMPTLDDPQIAQLKESTRNIIREILRADEKNSALAADKINHYKEQIRNLNQQKKGMGSYSKAYQENDAVYFDSKK